MSNTANAGKRDRGLLRVNAEECKGCGLCVEACPPKVIGLSQQMNRFGYRTAICPEPGAITVLRAANRAPVGVTA